MNEKYNEFKSLINFIKLIEKVLEPKVKKYILHYEDITIHSSCLWILKNLIKTLNSIDLLLNKIAISDVFSLTRKFKDNIFIFIYFLYVDRKYGNDINNKHYHLFKNYMYGGIDKDGQNKINNLNKNVNVQKILVFFDEEFKTDIESIDNVFYILNIIRKDLKDDQKFFSTFLHGNESIYSTNYIWEILIKQNPKKNEEILNKIILLQKFLILFVLLYNISYFLSPLGTNPMKPWERPILWYIKDSINSIFSHEEKEKILEKTFLLS
ncbi:hypothetical protein [Spiroplasma endosymbiont of Dasysyrphus albostriatus]|uniref:hypothetical protein n=1 Tax=Spiroplasma endosymbiont of Dasysyrphus albostriatus TaxID=3066299 RepID=UPI0030CB4E52